MGRRCEDPTCSKQASYGVEGTRRRQFCAQHAAEGMVDVCSKRCVGEGCSKHATFGVEGSRKREYCAKHADWGMVDLKLMRRCGFEGCSKHPSFGVEGGKREFCAEHADDFMVDLKAARKCEFGGCLKYPSFGEPGSGKRRFCSEHADVGMVDQKTWKRCARGGCSKHRSYGLEGGKREFCAEHSESAYTRAVEFVRDFHNDASSSAATGNGDIAKMLSKQNQQGDHGEMAGEEVPYAQQRQQRKQHNTFPVVLDSGCGTGRSSALLARSYPHLPVIGIDRSAVRLSKGEGGRHDRHRQGDGPTPQPTADRRGDDKARNAGGDVDDANSPSTPKKASHIGGSRNAPLPRNLLLLRADLVDLWVLASRDISWQVQEHYILYPNPYPKRSQLRSRWHGHSVFPVLLGLGGRITLRSNWKSYLDEFCQAVLAIDDEAGSAKGQEDPSAVRHGGGCGGGEGELTLEENVLSGVPETEVPAAVAAAAASYVASARAGPSLFLPTVPAATNFEAKYVAVGEPVYELRLEPRLPH
eukprot:g12298.t1